MKGILLSLYCTYICIALKSYLIMKKLLLLLVLVFLIPACTNQDEFLDTIAIVEDEPPADDSNGEDDQDNTDDSDNQDDQNEEEDDSGRNNPNDLKAFPTAYGGGALATGGRGGTVYHVTNLNNSGTGSLRWAIQQPRPAIVVFDVSGTIIIDEFLTITGDDLTIAGQTAPRGGITITSANNSRMRMSRCENIIIRYIRIRPQQTSFDAFEVFSDTGSGRNIILDHVSISYGGDETFSIRGRETTNITFQRGLIAEGKTGSLFGDSQSPENSFNNSMHLNLFWNISHRHPNANSDGRIDVINNVVHNWRTRLTRVGGDVNLNHINNYYSMGGRTNLGGNSIDLNQLNSVEGNEIYTAGNIIDKGFFEDPRADNRVLWAEFELGRQVDPAPLTEFVDTQYPLIGEPLPIQSAVDALQDVITNVGANAYLNADGSVSLFSDANDTEYLANMAAGEGAFEPYDNSPATWFTERRYLNFVASVSSTPTNTRPTDYDTDGDGMPDLWERNTFGDLNRTGRGDEDGDGYSDLEEFLNLVDN